MTTAVMAQFARVPCRAAGHGDADRDRNTAADSADILRLLAVGTGDVPNFGANRGFRATGDSAFV